MLTHPLLPVDPKICGAYPALRGMSGIDGGLDGASLELMFGEGKSGIKETSKDGMSAGDSSLLVVLGGKSGCSSVVEVGDSGGFK